MPSFEEIASQLDHEARLPADNWLARRMQTASSHTESIAAIAKTIRQMGDAVLNNRISTDLFITGTDRIKNEDPSEAVMERQVGILPVGNRKRWYDRGLWSPDVAMSVGIFLKDRYAYQKPGRPQPTGDVGLMMHVRTWGMLSQAETAAVQAIEGTHVVYGDNGFDRRGTIVTMQRDSYQPLFPDEVEAVMAPLSQHILSYFDIMGQTDLLPQREAGNFTSSAEAATQPTPVRSRRIDIAGAISPQSLTSFV